MKTKFHPNGISRFFRFGLMIWMVTLLSGCIQKRDKAANIHKDSFHLLLPDWLEKKLFDARQKKINFWHLANLQFNDRSYSIKQIKMHGQSALDFRRKSFYINVKDSLPFFSPERSDTLYLNKFILSAMSMDFSYMHNKLAHHLLQNVGLWPLYSSFTELYINNRHQGLYLVIEDPRSHLIDHRKATCIIRRGYDHRIAQIVDSRGKNSDKLKVYQEEFNEIYKDLTRYKGKELYDNLSKKLNLEQYFRKIAFDFVLRNGDATDEIYFYTRSTSKEAIYFEIMPWDYDDIFSELPHEVGRTDDLCGKCFGRRVYPDEEQHAKAINGRLIFSIEDDLDYAILNDDYLYFKYLESFDQLLKSVGTTEVESVLAQVTIELNPYFQIPEVTIQSGYDAKETDREKFLRNVDERRNELINRIGYLESEVRIQKEILAGRFMN